MFTTYIFATTQIRTGFLLTSIVVLHMDIIQFFKHSGSFFFVL